MINILKKIMMKIISSYLCGFTEDDSKEDIVKKSIIPPTEIRYITKSIIISICIATATSDFIPYHFEGKTEVPNDTYKGDDGADNDGSDDDQYVHDSDCNDQIK